MTEAKKAQYGEVAVPELAPEEKRRNPCGHYHHLAGDDSGDTGVPPCPIVLSCMRPMGHEGLHCALIPGGWATWEGVQ